MKTTGKELTLIEMAQAYPDEESARAYFEGIRWPDGRLCPHCGNCDQARIYERNQTETSRAGLYKCRDCEGSFTVTVGTVMEDSHIPLNKWLLAFYMMCASKTQVSALQLQRQLGLGSYRSAWHLCHRVRHALKEGNPSSPLGGTVEVDESWVGGRRTGRGNGYTGNKTQIVSLVERGGRVRTHVVDKITGKEVTKIMRENMAKSARLNTDESRLYDRVGKEFRSHDRVNHSKYEYGRFDRKTRRLATTNAVEGFFGNAKRSIDGTHHSISRRHAALYFAEVDYKYNTRQVTDGERTVGAIRRTEGKRLTLHAPKGK